MTGFAKHAVLLFMALRIGDFVNVAAGMWFVPKYVSPEDLGAVLPVTSFATFLSLPVFAFAMTMMKETACLAAAGERGRIKSLLCGVFAAAAVAMVAVLGVSAALMPRFLGAMRVSDASAGFLVIAAAFLGCVAPVYTDALQSLKRFRSLAAIEIVGSVVRFLAMLAIMPAKALAGYFAGQAALPLFRIAGSVAALWKDLAVQPEPFWCRAAVRRVALSFVAILAYQAIPMAASLVEHSMLRTALSPEDSAGYYMVSRFADFLHYLTFPLILVAFPYTAGAARNGESVRPFVLKCSAVTLAVSGLMAGVYFFYGAELLSLMPNGANYTQCVKFMPLLVLSNALTACQVFYANAEVSAGRFGFLAWLAPLHILYIFVLRAAGTSSTFASLAEMVALFMAASVLRFAFSSFCLWYNNR